jgi:hypothetical protein
VRRTFEEEGDRNLQDMGDLLQTARADAVGTLLVLLYLLEGQAQGVAQFFLTHVQHHPAHAHA